MNDLVYNLKDTGHLAALDEESMFSFMKSVMNGDMEDAQIAIFLTALAKRGETVDEITGAARALRAKAQMIKAPEAALDCCGTGGDGIGTYNISTAVAFVAAACGVPVAKHGNRAASSKSGAADVLEALGVNLDVSLPRLEEALQRLNFAFLMAPAHHQAMKHVANVRKNLGFRTIFNLLGPLANPAGTKYQLIGVFDDKWLVPLAETLKRLGTKRAWIVHGSDGMDEITITGPTKIAVLNNGTIEEREISPGDFGMAEGKIEDLAGGDAEENAAALKALLQGEQSGYRDIVLVNSAAVLNIHNDALSLTDAAKIAATAIDDGLAMKVLNNYAAFTQQHPREQA